MPAWLPTVACSMFCCGCCDSEEARLRSGGVLSAVPAVPSNIHSVALEHIDTKQGDRHKDWGQEEKEQDTQVNTANHSD